MTIGERRTGATSLRKDLRMRARPTETQAQAVGVEPLESELWAVSPEITNASGTVVEHSLAPLIVAVVRQVGDVFEVAPISFEIDLQGPRDVVVGQKQLFERPFMVECWLRLAVSPRALARRVGELSDEDWARVAKACGPVVPASDTASATDDARASYRNEERLRVMFAAAGAGSGEETDVVLYADALYLKNKARPFWRKQRAPRAASPTSGRPTIAV